MKILFGRNEEGQGSEGKKEGTNLPLSSEWKYRMLQPMDDNNSGGNNESVSRLLVQAKLCETRVSTSGYSLYVYRKGTRQYVVE